MQNCNNENITNPNFCVGGILDGKHYEVPHGNTFRIVKPKNFFTDNDGLDYTEIVYHKEKFNSHLDGETHVFWRCADTSVEEFKDMLLGHMIKYVKDKLNDR